MDELMLLENQPLTIDGVFLVATRFQQKEDGSNTRAILVVGEGDKEQKTPIERGAVVSFLGSRWEVTGIEESDHSADPRVAAPLNPKGSVTLVKRSG